MKKKILSLCLVICLLATAVIGGTLAYFTDTDDATNVMTIGSVAIEQYEKDKGGNDFEQNQKLYPAVDARAKGEEIVVDGFFSENYKNVIDKVITVKNTGTEDAYVRTIILFETNAEYEEDTANVLRDEVEIFKTYIGRLGSGVTYTDTVVEIEGVKYVVAYKVYEDALVAGEESAPSLKQFFMSPDADNEISTLFGEEYTILALSQGVQTEGFANAADALNTAFGEITAGNVVAWYTE